MEGSLISFPNKPFWDELTQRHLQTGLSILLSLCETVGAISELTEALPTCWKWLLETILRLNDAKVGYPGGYQSTSRTCMVILKYAYKLSICNAYIE
jgi:hypothetical protein